MTESPPETEAIGATESTMMGLGGRAGDYRRINVESTSGSVRYLYLDDDTKYVVTSLLSVDDTSVLFASGRGDIFVLGGDGRQAVLLERDAGVDTIVIRADDGGLIGDVLISNFQFGVDRLVIVGDMTLITADTPETSYDMLQLDFDISEIGLDFYGSDLVTLSGRLETGVLNLEYDIDDPPAVDEISIDFEIFDNIFKASSGSSGVFFVVDETAEDLSDGEFVALFGGNMPTFAMAPDRPVVDQVIAIDRAFTLDVSSLFFASSTMGVHYSATGLPDGITLDPITGRFSGMSAVARAYSVVVTAVDTDGARFWDSFTLYVDAPDTRGLAGTRDEYTLLDLRDISVDYDLSTFVSRDKKHIVIGDERNDTIAAASGRGDIFMLGGGENRLNLADDLVRDIILVPTDGDEIIGRLEVFNFQFGVDVLLFISTEDKSTLADLGFDNVRVENEQAVFSPDLTIDGLVLPLLSTGFDPLFHRFSGALGVITMDDDTSTDILNDMRVQNTLFGELSSENPMSFNNSTPYVARVIESQNISSNTPWIRDLNLFFKDADNDDSLTFDIRVLGKEALPSEITLSPVGVLSITPPATVESYYLIVTATDTQSANTIQSFNLIFNNVPILAQPLAGVTVSPHDSFGGKGVGGRISFTDADLNQPLTFVVTTEDAESNATSLTLTQKTQVIKGLYGVFIFANDSKGVAQWNYISTLDPTASEGTTPPVERVTIHAHDSIDSSAEAHLVLTLESPALTPIALTKSGQGEKHFDITEKHDRTEKNDMAVVLGGNGVDHIKAGRAGDTIRAGRGIDKIELYKPDSSDANPPSVDTVVYTFDARDSSGWIAYDGADKIENFQHGIDRLVLRARVDNNTDSAFFRNSANSNLILHPHLTEGGDIAGIDLVFAASGGGYGRIQAGNTFTIDFAEPLSFEIFATRIGGIQNYDSVREQVRDITWGGRDIFGNIFRGVGKGDAGDNFDVIPIGVTNSTISGEVLVTREDDVLTARLLNIVGDELLNQQSYRWIKFDVSEQRIVELPAERATEVSYSLQPDDVGDAVRVVVNFSGADGADSLASEVIRIDSVGAALDVAVFTNDDQIQNLDLQSNDDLILFADIL